MGWGEVLSTVGSAALGGTAGNVVGFLGNLISYGENSKKQQESEDNYYRAIAQQRALAEQQAQLAQQQSQWDAILRSNIYGQSTAMSADLATAQQAMGAMPQFDQGALNQDYSQTKAYMTNDFMDALKLIESQGRSDQIERLGGATSRTADNDRLRTLMKQYAPTLAEIDKNAMNQAIARQTGTMNLINTSRQNTLNEIQGVYTPGISANTQLLNNTQAMSGINSASTNAGNIAGEYKSLNEGQNNAMADALKTMQERINATYNPSRPAATRYEDINWNSGRWGS